MEKEFLISKEDFKKYFECKRVVMNDELHKYYRKNINNFNAIFNATPRKSYKKRRGMR